MSSKITPSHAFYVDKFHICVFECHKPDCPIIYLHDLDGYGRQVLPILHQQGLKDFTLVTITIPLDLWSHVLAPWNTPEGYPQYVACTGGAQEYLKLFVETIIPKVEAMLPPASWRGLAGYSLAGLFGIYALCETDHLFDRVESASGSLWYPDFYEWFLKHFPLHLPQSVFFSCGADEFETNNPYLSPVKPCTMHIEEWFAAHGVETTLEINPGNHYQDVLPRTAAGLAWILQNPKTLG